MACTRARFAVAAVAAVTLTLVAPTGVASATTVGDPIVEGLVLPLGLSVGDDGTVYVSEAGAGRLTSLDKHGKATVLVDAPGEEIAGVDAKGKGTVVYTQTLFDGNAGEEAPPLDAILGRVRPNGKTSQVASTQDFEAANNPDSINDYGLVDPSDECLAQVEPFFPPVYSGIVESHPYAVAIVPGGYAVADAAGNTILRVSANGTVSTVAVLPPVEQTIDQDAVDQIGEEGVDISECLGATFLGEPVPTDIEVGPDGAYYVSTLPGFPENVGAGSVWKVDPATGDTELIVTGLAGPVDIAVAGDGTIYVAELFGFQISTIVGGVVTDSVFADSPGAIEIGRNGKIYATIGAFGNGAVVEITP
jgi:hypothetical protein